MMNLTFKRMTSLLLAFAMIISTIGIDTSKLYASASETAEKIEITEIDTTTADYPIMLRNRINTARLTKIGLYSKLTAEEKHAVCEYYALTDSAFVAAEKAGYNILDSARIIKAANAAEITPAEYKEYVESYGSEEEASANLRGYKLFEPSLSDKSKAEFKKLMKNGHNYSELRSTYIDAEKLGTSMETVISGKVPAEKQDTLQTETTALTRSEVAEMSSVTSESISLDSPINSLTHEFISAPSTYFAGENEMVSTVTGALNYRENIVDLKGRNGLDLDLDLIFTGNSNMYWGEQPIYKRDLDGEIYEDEDGNRTIVGWTRADWYNESDVIKQTIPAPYGIGWSFNLPSVSYTYERTTFTENDKSTWVLRYHPKDGGAYKVIDDNDSNANTMALEGYPRDDIQFIKQSGSSSRYRVTFADGRYELYNSHGKLVETGDRFGNKITFEYYVGYPGREYDNELKSITDSLGRKIEITYPYSTADLMSFDVIIELPDGSEVRLSLERYGAGGPLLLTSINNRPGHTSFKYVESFVDTQKDSNGNIEYKDRTRELKCSDESYLSSIGTIHDGKNEVLNIAEITYNTGLISRYSYDAIPVNNGMGGMREIMRVTERYETFASDATSDISQVKKNVQYTYDTHDYSGYSMRSGSSTTYADPNNLPEGFSSFVIKRENMMQTQIGHNNKHNPVSVITSKIETYGNGDEETTMVASETISYDAYQRPVRHEKKDWRFKSIELYENDSKGNVIKHWSTLANDVKNDEYVTVYTYDSTYNLPTSVTYKKDADTTVTETYTLTEDKKSIAKKEVAENGEIKERTEYTYDSYGNITRERKYKSNTEYIDINYDYSDTEGITRPTGVSFAGAYLTKKWQNGGNDIDGNAIGNVEYKYEYDIMGNQTKVVDPLGNSTSYEYDIFRRLKKITNPDNTTQTFAYTVDTTANETVHTDEAGTRIKYIYDKANNLTDVLDLYDDPDDPLDGSGETLKSYDYDRWYNLIKERNVQLITSGYEITYTYDQLNRIIAKETKDYYDTTVAKEIYDYDFGESNANYLITTQTIVGDSFAPSITTKEYVDKNGNVEKIGYVTGNNEYFTTYKYDYLGTKTEELAAIADQKDWTNTFTSKWEYDYAGRVLREYDASNNFISYEYDWLGRPIKAYDRVSNASANPYYTSYTYDNLGNVIQETIPQIETTNKVTKYKYDKLGNLTLEKKLYDIVDGEEIYHSTSYSYDWRGNVTTATQDIYPTTYTYDALGRCLTSTTGGKTTTYTYDRFGNVLTETFGGKTDTYEYDMNMFRTKHIYPSGKRITYEPNALQKTYAIMSSEESGGRTFEYTMTGALLQASDASYIGRIRRKYDDRGNIIEEENTGMTKTYTYDISGKRESMVARTPTATIQNLTYTYNNLEQMTAVKNNGYNKVAYEYDANGQVAKNRRFGAFTFDMDYTYNRDGSLASVLRTEDYGDDYPYTMEYAYTYYYDGNLKTDIEPYKPTKIYTYNSRNMLATESLSTGEITTYEYDENGNMTCKFENIPGAYMQGRTAYTYDNQNRLISRTLDEPNGIWSALDEYIYDDNGNLTRIERFNPYTNEEATETFSYNGYGEMSSSTVGGVTTTYTYYADGLRRSKTTGGVTTYHMLDGDDVIADLNGSYELTDLYLRGIAGQLEMYDDGNAEWSYIAPIHGDVRELLAMGNGVATTYTYDAFGNHTENDWHDLDNPFRYSGEYYDEETGFIYLRARYYDPTIGRFISEDPIRDGLNWYVYCENNPIMYVDPSGLKPTEEEAAIMIQNLYSDFDESICAIPFGGWKREKTKRDVGMYMGIYSRVLTNGEIEYALVSKGSLTEFIGDDFLQTCSDWLNNILAPLGLSYDIWAGVDFAKDFVRAHKKNEITFIGHSKGGAEAAANAVATNRNAMLFNPMVVNLGAYGLSARNYTADMTAYIINGEILNNIFGAFSKPIDKVVYYPSQYDNSVDNHSMDAFIKYYSNR